MRVRGRDTPLVALLVRAARARLTASTVRHVCACGSWFLRSLLFLSQDLPRPFAKLRALDLEVAAADVVKAL